MYEFERSKVPLKPGVYIYFDRFGTIIYVGKAKNLRSRVSSYFTAQQKLSPKTQVLVNNIFDVDFIVVDSEVEALILENKLIKKHKPKYNILLKDSKTYSYIKLTNDRVPKLMITRRLTDDGDFFGPFTDTGFRNELLNLTVRLFGIITNKTFSTKSKLNYDIGLAPAPSLLEIDVDLYSKNVKLARDFLNGKNVKSVQRKLKAEMNVAKDDLKFELALEKKKQIEAIDYLFEKQNVETVKNYDQDVIALVEDYDKSVIVLFNVSKGVISGKKEFRLDVSESLFEDFVKMFYSQNYIPREVLVSEKFWEIDEDKIVLENYLSKLKGVRVKLSNPKRGEKKSLVELVRKNALLNIGKDNVSNQLKEVLGLKNVPNVIEVFDMSNLSYDFLVGGMTRWVNESPDKNGYRKFNIKSFSGKNDDFTAMKEVLERRYSRLVSETAELPNLVIIDGGKGQLGVAIKVFESLDLLDKVDLISIAKGENRDKNEIYIVGVDEPLIFDNESNMMLYLRKVRDSVHDFVIGFNRQRRNMKLKEGFEEYRKV